MSLSNELIRIDPKCSWKELSGQVVILQGNCNPPMTHELNSTGSFVWTFLAERPKKFSEVLEAAIENFEVGVEELETDLTSLIKKLESLNLVKLGL